MMWWWSWCYSRFWIMTKGSIGSSDLNNRKIWLCLTLRDLSHNWSLTWCTLQIIWSWSIRPTTTRIAPAGVTDSESSTIKHVQNWSPIGRWDFVLHPVCPFEEESIVSHATSKSSIIQLAVLNFCLVRRHCTHVTESARKFCWVHQSEWFPIKCALCTSC